MIDQRKIEIKREFLHRIVKLLRCVGKYGDGDIGIDPRCSTGTILPHLVVTYQDHFAKALVDDELDRELSTSELLAIEALLGDGRAGAALVDYLQENGLCPVAEIRNQEQHRLLVILDAVVPKSDWNSTGLNPKYLEEFRDRVLR